MKIGYVPRSDSVDVSDCIDMNRYYVATVKKIIGIRFPVPVIALQFYRSDQLADLADLNLQPNTTGAAGPDIAYFLAVTVRLAVLRD